VRSASIPSLHLLTIFRYALATPVASSGSKPAPAPPKAAKADDFDNMFGDEEPAKPKDEFADIFDYGETDETEEEKAANKARQERMAHARKLKEEKDAKDGKVKKPKEKLVEKSLVVLEVKPWEADTDLEMVWREILKYQQEGLSWGETFKLEPVAYGIKKLVLTCTIVDSLVLLDDITDNIEALEQYVQSVSVAAMNKI
jgi:elongation factor 1-beta